MKRVRFNLLILLGLALCLALPAAVIADHDDGHDVVQKGRVKIVVTDDEGDPHVRTYEFDGDGPRAFLGVAVESADGGLVVERLIEDSAAERAGIQQGDIIVSVDGEAMERALDLTHRILQAEPGDRVDIEIQRDGGRQTLGVELGEREGGAWMGAFGPEGLGEHFEQLHERLGEMEFDFDLGELHERLGNMQFDFGDTMVFRSQRPRLGVQLVQTTPELREHLGGSADAGVLVGKVLEGTPAEDAGLEVGDLIVSADGKPLSCPGQLIHALDDKSGDSIELEVIRNGRSFSVEAYIPQDEEPEIELPSGPRA